MLLRLRLLVGQAHDFLCSITKFRHKICLLLQYMPIQSLGRQAYVKSISNHREK